LVEMLSSNMKQAVVEGTKALDRDKVALYASTVEAHNDVRVSKLTTLLGKVCTRASGARRLSA